MSKPPMIAVFGSSSRELPFEVEQIAERLGEGIARRGWSLITGGYGGVMEAASRGARLENEQAHVIGVTTDHFAQRGGANVYVNDERRQKGLLERIGYLMEAADAYLVVWGSIGTLAELFLAWNLVVTGKTRPLIAVGPWWDEFFRTIHLSTEISSKELASIDIARDAEKALECLNRTWNPSPSGD